MENSTLDSISALTGLPINNVKNSTGIRTPQDDAVFNLTGVKNINPTPNSGRPTVDPLDTYSQSVDLTHRYKDPIESYQDYNVPLNPFLDWSEKRAENQGVVEKWTRGTIKMGGTILGTVAENTIGIVAGIGSMASGDTYANNFVGNSVDEMNGWLSENLPHYYTRAEMDPNRSVLSSMGTANFWSDKFLNGLGYSLGSIATIWMSGGTGLLGRTASAAARGLMTAETIAGVASTAKTGETLKNIYAASKMIKTGAKLTDDIAKYSTIARGLNAVKTLEVGAMMSLGEASVEAREKSKQLREELISDWEEQNPGQEMSREKLTEIEEAVAAMSNTTLAANLAVLMPTNLLMFGKMLAGAKVGEKATYDLVKQGDEITKALPNTTFGKRFAKINEIASPVYKNALVEAFQEGAQFMIGDAGVDYYKNKFQTGTEDLSSSLSKALSNTFGTADGLESMLLGALIGGGMGGASTSFGADAKLRQAKSQNTEKLIALYNSNTFKTLAADLALKENGANLISALDAAQVLGNKQVAKELRTNLIANEVLRYEQLDALDLAFERLDDLAMLTDEEFAKALRFDLSKPLSEQLDGKNKTMVVEELKKEMKDLSKLGKDIDSIIETINPKTTGIGALFQSKEAKQQEAALALQNQKLKTLLMSSMIGIKERDNNIDESIQELRDLSPQSQSFVTGFAAFDRDKLLTAVKRNKITVNEQGELIIPNNLVDINITDTEAEKKKDEKPLSTDEYFDRIEQAKIKNSSKLKRRQKEDGEVITALDKAIEASKLYDAVAKAKFDNAIINLFRNINARENAIAAFNELVTNPNKREVVMAAKTAAATKAKVDQANKEAVSILDKLQTTEDVDNLIDFDRLTPEVAEDVKRKYEELKKIEDQYIRDYSSFSDENLLDLMKGFEEIKSQDPQRALALQKVAKARATETPEEKEQRLQNKTPEQLAAEEKVRQEIASQVSNTQQEMSNAEIPKFQNNFEIIDPSGTIIRINGVTYTNLNANPVDALTIEEVEVVEEQTASATPNSDIEAKKADIEKRRQERLTPISKENPNGYFENTGVYKKDKITGEEYYDPDTKNGTYSVDFSEDKEIDDFIDANSIQELKDKINAKYDAELTALEGIQPASTKKEETVTKVTLTNELGQEVIFKREDNEELVNELAQILMIIQQSEGTIESINIDENKLTEDLQTETTINTKNFNMIKFKYDVPVAQMSDDQLVKAVKELTTLETAVVNTISKYRAQAFRQGKDITDVNAIPEVKANIELLETIKESKSKFASENFDRNKINSTISAQESVPGTLSEEEEKKLVEELGLANKIVTDLKEKITNLKNRIEDFESGIAIGVLGEDAIAEKTNLEEELKELNISLEQANADVINKSNIYESRKSSETDSNIQDAKRTEGNLEEQGSESEDQRDAEVSQQEKPDVNALVDTLYEAEEVSDLALTDAVISESIITLGEDEEELTYEDNVEDPVPVVEGDVQSTLEGVNVNVADSEYAYNVDNKVIINEFEETSRNPYFPYDHSTEGIAIEQDYLSDQELTPIGTEVTFEPRPDLPYFSDQNIPANEQWKTVPIYITVINPFTNEKAVIGLLEPYNPTHAKGRTGSNRQRIFEEFKKGNTVSAILTGKIARPANAVGEDNNPYFFNPLNVEGFVPGIVVATPENGLPKWSLGTPGTELDSDLDTSAFKISSSELGTVAFVFKHPSEGVQHLKGVTKRITDLAYNRVVELIEEGNDEAVSLIVGFNKIDNSGIENTDKSLVLQRVSGNGRNTITSYIFYHTAADSYIRISSNDLKNALTGNTFKYSFVEFNRNAKNSIDIEAVQKTPEEYAKYAPQVADYFQEAIMSKRFQVDLKELRRDATRTEEDTFISPMDGETEYATYLEFLTDPDAVGDIENQGHRGILSHDLVLNNDNNPYFHTQPRFGNLIINGATLEEERQTINKEVKKSKVNTTVPAKRNDDTYEEESDDNSVDPDFAVSNDNRYLDDDEDTIIQTAEELEQDEDSAPEANPNATSLESLVGGRTVETIEQPVTPDKEETLKSSVQTVLDKIQTEDFEGMVVDPITKQETHYLIKGLELDRITSKVYGEFKGTEQQKKNSSSAGTAVHNFVEAAFENKPFSRPENLSRLAFLQIKSQIERIKEHIAGKKQTIVAIEKIVYNIENRIAGRFDLLVKNQSGTYTLYDIKTGSEAGLENYDKEYVNPETNEKSPSKRQLHGTQLSIYGYLLRGHMMDNNQKMDISRGNVLYIPLDINESDGLVKSAGTFEEKSFVLSNNLKNLLAGTETFEKKETKKAADPAVKNAGKKKATTSTKKNEDKGNFKVKTTESKSKKTSSDSNIKVKSAKDVINNFEKFDTFTDRFAKTDADKVGSLIHFFTKPNKSGTNFLDNRDRAIPMIIEEFEDVLGIELTEKEAVQVRELMLEKFCK